MGKTRVPWKLLPIAVFSALLLICLSMVCRNLSEYIAGAKSYLRLQEYIFPVMPDKYETAVGTDDHVWPQVDFAALRDVNPDIEAWLVLEDTEINYPVVQGGDNDYYLTHMFDGTANKCGCLFIDSRNEAGFTDRNTIIYGHNMKDGSMFNALEGYREQAYYDARPQMLLLTPEGNYTLELLAGYICGEDSSAWTRNFADDAEFEEWLLNAIAKSLFSSEFNALDYDRTVTLSTCADDYQNAFLVVIAGLTLQP